MTDRIEIKFRPSEGAIVRLIGLVERRGFEVRGVDLPNMGVAADVYMGLHLRARDGGRKVETLCAQISKVYGVTSVHASPVALGAAS